VLEKNTENSWIDGVKNEEVFQRMEERKVICKNNQGKEKKWIGHIIIRNNMNG